MRARGVLCIAAALFAVPLAGRAADAPLRTMVYHFALDVHNFGGGASIDYTNNHVQEGGTSDMGGRAGTIKVAVVKATADGGMVADVTEAIDVSANGGSLQPPQTVRCAVYGATGDVICDQNFHASAEERTLLTYVGRFFYDPSRLDTSGHWQTVPALKSPVTITNDYTVTKSDGSLVTISVDRSEHGLGYQAVTTGTIVYNAAMELPDSIHLSTSAVNSGNQGDESVDLSLISDSMAAAAGQSSH